MANQIFNVSKGRINQFVENVEQDDPTGCEIVIVLLKTAEADATLIDYDTLAALLAGSNTEADFTNYARKVLTAPDMSRTVDDTANSQYSTFVDQTWTAAGGTTDNTTAKLIVCYDPLGTGVDANLIPMSHHDFVGTTDGNDFGADFGTSTVSAA